LPSGRNMCAIDVQINMTMPPRMPARRIFIRRKEGRKIGSRRKRPRLNVQAGAEDGHPAKST
jgi:hypothetical protein